MLKTSYEKLRTKVLGIVEGLALSDDKYFNVRKAFCYAEKIHSNLRKDGSPEFSHQLEMLSLALSLHSTLNNPYAVYIAIILHDTLEDYPEFTNAIYTEFPDVAEYSAKLSKFKDSDGNYYEYFDNISDCEVCSVVKAIDRIHNLSTAVGVFSTEKLKEYCQEVEKYFFTMIHEAKSKFNQRSTYEVLKFMLITEVRMIEYFLEQKE